MTQAELDWFYGGGAARFFPEEWEAFTQPIPEAEQGDLIGAYYKRLISADEAVQTLRTGARPGHIRIAALPSIAQLWLIPLSKGGNLRQIEALLRIVPVIGLPVLQNHVTGGALQHAERRRDGRASRSTRG